MCAIGWYDPGVELCKICHYSWLNYSFKTIIKVLMPKMIIIVVVQKIIQIFVKSVIILSRECYSMRHLQNVNASLDGMMMELILNNV